MAVDLYHELPDGLLVVASLAGEVAAFDVLVRRYRSAVMAVAWRRCGGRALAEDACQETFLRAFKALRHLREPEQFAAWLYAIARREASRVAIGEVRTAHVPLDEQILTQSGALEESDWAMVLLHETQAEVRQAMAALPEEFQIPLVLHYWRQMPLEEISRFVGKPVSTIKWRMHRARALMRAHLVRSRAEALRNTARRDHEPGTERKNDGTAPHRADAGDDGGARQRRRADGRRAERRRPPHLQCHPEVSDRHR